MRRPILGNVVLVLALLFLTAQDLRAFPQAAATQPSKPQPRFDIAKVDLFGLKDWRSDQVSILGFMLGMSRPDVLRSAQQNELHLDDDHGQGCLKDSTCSVFSGHKYCGIALLFDEGDALDKIRVELQRRNASREERSSWLATKFQGTTLQFAESYSDNLRIRILGFPDAMSAGGILPPPLLTRPSAKNSSLPHREYQYSRKGVVLLLDLQEGAFGGEDGPFENLTLEFVRPAKSTK